MGLCIVSLNWYDMYCSYIYLIIHIIDTLWTNSWLILAINQQILLILLSTYVNFDSIMWINSFDWIYQVYDNQSIDTSTTPWSLQSSTRVNTPSVWQLSGIRKSHWLPIKSYVLTHIDHVTSSKQVDTHAAIQCRNGITFDTFQVTWPFDVHE